MDGERFFSDVAYAARRIEPLRRQVSAIEDDLATCGPHGSAGGGGSHGTTSDPTYSSVLKRQRAGKKLDALKRELDECISTVGEGLAVLHGMAVALGEPTAAAMERHYVDGISWSMVADELHVSERTILRRRSVAIDWLSDVGPRRAKAGALTREEFDTKTG